MAIRFAQSAAKPTVRKERTLDPIKPKHAGGRPKSVAPKELLTLRLDPDVIGKFKATGKGWQARINEALKAAKL